MNNIILLFYLVLLSSLLFMRLCWHYLWEKSAVKMIRAHNTLQSGHLSFRGPKPQFFLTEENSAAKKKTFAFLPTL